MYAIFHSSLLFLGDRRNIYWEIKNITIMTKSEKPLFLKIFVNIHFESNFEHTGSLYIMKCPLGLIVLTTWNWNDSLLRMVLKQQINFRSRKHSQGVFTLYQGVLAAGDLARA